MVRGYGESVIVCNKVLFFPRFVGKCQYLCLYLSRKTLLLPITNNVSVPMNVSSTIVAAAMAAMLCCGCGDGRSRSILPHTVDLREGDIVLRRGNGMTSRFVLAASRGGYSHVGIVADSAGVKMVVHAVPGEPDYAGDPDRVKMEPAARFFISVNASTGCVLRHGDSALAARAAAEAVRLYRQGTLFDHDYDDGDTTRMYCCELVMAAYRRAGWPMPTGGRHSFDIPGMRIDSVVLPTDFLRVRALRRVAEF